MRTRTYLWIFAAAVIVSVAVWILQDRSPLDADPSRLPATKHKSVVIDPVQTTTTAVVIARLKEKDRSRLEAAGERLVEDARNALEAGDKQGFDINPIEGGIIPSGL